MAVTKRLRFDVFKRDQFTCQYCGRKPPMVILEADHVIPVAEGGPDEIENLVTACFDCNRGKGAVPLDQVPTSLSDRMEEEKARRAQMEAYNQFLLEQREAEQRVVEELGWYWFNKFNRKKDQYVFGHARVPSIKRFLKTLAPAEIMDAMDIAHSRHSPWGDRDDKTFRYFCGICWNRIREREATSGDEDES